ncbi:MAG: tetratricopeptide repeat protein [Chloroflexota bacterium]|nr:tetratricopeptide repeat protein [Chloroflexota bacterium]
MARAGRELRGALLGRAGAGDLPLGADTPGIWTLARGYDMETPGSSSTAVRRAVEEQRLQRAAALLKKLPAPSWLEGVALASAGQYEEAEVALSAVLASDPEDPFALLALGNLLDEKGRQENAHAIWKRANLDQAVSQQLHRIGSSLDSSEGEAMLLLATEIDPRNSNAYHALAGRYWHSDRQKAVELYEKSLANDLLAPFYRYLAEGRLALDQERWQEATGAFENAVAIRPKRADVRQHLATSLRKLGRNQEAITQLKQAAQLAETNPWPLVHLGEIYVEERAFDEAIAALAAASQRQNDLAIAFVLLGRAYRANEQLNPSVEAWERAVELAPENPGYHLRLAEVLAATGETERAILAVQEALRLNPNNAHALRLLESLDAGTGKAP